MTFVDISAMHAHFSMKFYTTVNDKMYTSPWSFVELWQNYAALTKTTPISHVMQNCLRADFIETLQITHWAITSGLSCLGCHAGQVTINFSRSLRWQVNWMLSCRPPGKCCRRNTNKLVANFTECLMTAYMVVAASDCHFEHSAVILSISKFAYSSPTNQLFRSTIRLPMKTTLKMLRNWGCLGWNSIIWSFSDTFQQNLVLKCIFYCLTCENMCALLKYQQKS